MYHAVVAPKHAPHTNVQLPPIRSTNTTHHGAAGNLAQSHRAAADAELSLISTFNQEIRKKSKLAKTSHSKGQTTSKSNSTREYWLAKAQSENSEVMAMCGMVEGTYLPRRTSQRRLLNHTLSLSLDSATSKHLHYQPFLSPPEGTRGRHMTDENSSKQRRHHRRHRHRSPKPGSDGSGADAGSGNSGTPTREVYVSKFQRRKTHVSELGDLNYGFELALQQASRPPTVHEKRNSVYQRKSARQRQTTGKEQSDQQSDTASDYSDNDCLEMTSSAISGNLPVRNVEVARGKETAEVQSRDETPETENQGVATENTEDILSRDDGSSEKEKAESSGGDPEQEAVLGREAEPGGENDAADEEITEGEDPFAELPPLPPYQDPPVFKGHTNYGFEIIWTEQERKERHTDDTDEDKAKTEESSDYDTDD